MKSVKLTSKLNKEVIKPSNKENILYLHVELNPLINTSIIRKNSVNLGLVIDKSGSMYDDDKLDNVILAIKHAIDHLNPDDNLSVVAFGSHAEIISESSEHINKQQLKKEIDGLDDLDLGYETNLKQGLDLSIKETMKTFIPGGMNKIIILTDGEVDHPDECNRIVENYKNKGIYFTTIGVGQEFNEDFLINIANISGARSHYIENPAQIPAIFKQEIENINNSVLQGCEIRVGTFNNCEIRRMIKSEPDIAIFNNENTIRFDTINSDEKQSVLLELIVTPENQGKFKIAKVDLISGNRIIDEEMVYLTVSPDEILTKKINNVVTQVINKIKTYDIQTKALDKVKRGDTLVATKMFGNLKNESNEKLVTMALDQIQKTSRLDPVVTKKLRYGGMKYFK